MKKTFFTPIMITLIFALTIVTPTLACPPDDPNCESSTEVTGSVYDQFNKTYGDANNGGAYTGEGFMNLFAKGKNLAEVSGEIKSQGEGALSPNNLSAWSQAKMEFAGTTTHDEPGESSIEAGGGVCQTSFVGKDNTASYAGAAQTGMSSFEAAKTTAGFQGMVASWGETTIGFVDEPGHAKATADAENQSITNNGTSATNAYAVNQVVGGAQIGATTGQFTGTGEIGNCKVPVWTKGTGFVDITQAITPTSYTSNPRVFAHEQTGTGIKPE